MGWLLGVRIYFKNRRSQFPRTFHIAAGYDLISHQA